MKKSPLDVLVLCGGRGTRLGALVDEKPKPMMDVGGRPFLDILIEDAAGRGYDRFLLLAGYLDQVVARHYEPRGLRVSVEDKPLGTAGAIKHAGARFTSDPFLVLNGDSYCPVDLDALVSLLEKSGGVGAMALTRDPSRKDGGSVVIAADGRVTAFVEKGSAGANAYINAGVYVLRRSVLEKIPAGRMVSLEAEIFPALLAAGLYGLPVNAPLHDIGTPERLEAFRRSRG